MSRPEPQPAEKPNLPPVVVKKYANRRLYNTESSTYITLENLAEMVRAGRDFVVYDAKTGEDITRSVLTQIIVDEENKGRALLPTNFLRQLIGFYGDSMQGLVPEYLEQAMTSFAHQQEQMRLAMQNTMQSTIGNLFPFGGVDQLGKQNMAMMERAMSLFSPFGRGQEEGESAQPDAGSPAQPAAVAPGDVSSSGDVSALRGEIERLRNELAQAKAAPEPKKAQG